MKLIRLSVESKHVILFINRAYGDRRFATMTGFEFVNLFKQISLNTSIRTATVDYLTNDVINKCSIGEIGLNLARVGF